MRFGVIFWAICCGVAVAADPPKKAAPPPVATSKPAAAPVVVDPLAGLPKAVALPSVSQSPKKPQVLGKLVVSPQTVVVMTLLGGELAPRLKPRAFVLAAVGDEISARAWKVELTPARSGEPVRTVGKFEIVKDQLLFTWDEFAEEDATVELLANCLITVAAGKSQKMIALRKPQPGTSLKLSLTDETNLKWQIPLAPENGRIKIEVTLPDKIPRNRFVGSSSLKPAGEDTWIEYLEKEVTGLVQVRLEVNPKGDALELRATPYLSVLGKKMAISEGTVKKAESQLQAAQGQMKQQLQQIAQAVKSVAPPKGKNNASKSPAVPPQVAQAKAALEKQLSQTSAAAGKLTNVAKFLEQYDKKQTLNTRVYFEIDGHVVDLISQSK